MTPEIARKVVTLFRRTPRPAEHGEGLTPHETRLLRLLAEGYSYQEAADRLPTRAVLPLSQSNFSDATEGSAPGEKWLRNLNIMLTFSGWKSRERRDSSMLSFCRFCKPP